MSVVALAPDDWLRWRALRLAGQGVVLPVHADNLAARRLYARHDFVDAGPSPDDPGELRMVHDPLGAIT